MTSTGNDDDTCYVEADHDGDEGDHDHDKDDGDGDMMMVIWWWWWYDGWSVDQLLADLRSCLSTAGIGTKISS